MKSPVSRPGIYSITFPTGARYIGSARNIRLRWHEHKSALRKTTHKNVRLQRSWDTHGEAGATFSALIFCSVGNLILYEQLALNALSPGLNICLLATSALGVKRSPETLERMAKSRIGRTLTPEHRKAIGDAHLGQKRSLEARAAMKAARPKGWKHTEETKSKMKGRKVGENTRCMMSANAKGNKNRQGSVVPPELRQQISAKLKGRKLPMSTRIKMSQAKRRKPGQLGFNFDGNGI